MIDVIDLSIASDTGSSWKVRHFDLSVGAGDACALLGVAGSGKTSVLEAVAGLSAFTSGQIRIGSRQFSAPRASTGGVTAVWGVGALDDAATVRQNIQLFVRVSRADRLTDTELVRVFRQTDVPDRALSAHPRDLTPLETLGVWLSIARLRCSCAVLLDDSDAMFSETERVAAADLIRDLASDGMAVLVATRNTEFACAIAKRVCVLERGQIVASGPPSRVFQTLPFDDANLTSAGSPIHGRSLP